MNIIGAIIRWRIGWGNSPEIHLTLDKKPNFDRIYNSISIGGKTYYYSVVDGIVSAFMHDPSYEGGFGGRHFELNMEDGTIKTIRGPWDAGSSTFNKLTGMKAIQISYNYPFNEFNLFYASMALIEPVEAYLTSFHPGLSLKSRPTQTTGGDDTQSVIILHGSKVISDTVVYELQKDMRFMIGYYLLEDKWHKEDCYSILQDAWLTSFFNPEGRKYYPPNKAN